MLLTFLRTRRGLFMVVVACLALLSRPVHATDGSRRLEVRIELTADSAPQLAAALEPGGEANLRAVVESIDGEIEPTACAAHLETAPDGSGARIGVADCAGTDFSAAVQASFASETPAASAQVSYDGQGGTSGDAALFCLILVIVIIVIIVLSE